MELDLGYFFYPSNPPEALGHSRLDIFIRPKPTERHFDPERLYVQTISPYGGAEKTTVDHPWSGLNSYSIFPGRFFFVDWKDKSVEAFCFGGMLEIETLEDDHTLCMITSPAPILSLELLSSPSALFALEVDILLAERRGAWAHDLITFEKRLAAIEPATLYRVCLNEVLIKMTTLSKAGYQESNEFIRTLRIERERYSKDRQTVLPALHNLV